MDPRQGVSRYNVSVKESNGEKQRLEGRNGGVAFTNMQGTPSLCRCVDMEFCKQI
jgi:hypothetical protein